MQRVKNSNRCDCLLKSKEDTTDLSIHQCTVIYTYNCRVGLKQKFQIRYDWILSIRGISEKVSDSVGYGFGIRHISGKN